MSSETIRGLVPDPPQRSELPSATHVLVLGVVGGIGISTLAIHFLHLLANPEGVVTVVFGAVLPMGLSLALLGVVAWLHIRRVEALTVSIGLWCVVGSLVLVGVSVTSITYQLAHGVEMTGVPFVIANHATVGAILGTLLGFYDGQRGTRTSDLRAERERARRLSDRLTVLNRLLRHDIRNAVNVIRGNTELIRSGSQELELLTETIDRKATELLELGERASKIEQLLDRETVPRTAMDIAPPLKAKLHKLDNDHPDIDVEVAIPDSLDVRSISLVEDALDELLENAVEHNDADAPLLSVSATADADGSGFVRIRILDNGSGIPDTEVEALERGRETELKHSSGIGLWFVRWVVDRSGGRLDFEDREPRGSVVTLRLPSAEAHDSERATRSRED